MGYRRQRDMIRMARMARAAGDDELALDIDAARLVLARETARPTCRTCEHWRAETRWCDCLRAAAHPIQGCGHHEEVTG